MQLLAGFPLYRQQQLTTTFVCSCKHNTLKPNHKLEDHKGHLLQLTVLYSQIAAICYSHYSFAGTSKCTYSTGHSTRGVRTGEKHPYKEATGQYIIFGFAIDKNDSQFFTAIFRMINVQNDYLYPEICLSNQYSSDSDLVQILGLVYKRPTNKHMA